MKSLIAIVATLFAVSSFAGEPAKKDEKKAEPVKAEKKAETKSEKKADAKK